MYYHVSLSHDLITRSRFINGFIGGGSMVNNIKKVDKKLLSLKRDNFS